MAVVSDVLSVSWQLLRTIEAITVNRIEATRDNGRAFEVIIVGFLTPF
jgi:hypothetical protein